jgi:hypothetical protein
MLSLAVVLALTVAVPPARGQSAEPTLNSLLMQRLTGGVTLPRYLEQLRQEFQRLDADSDGKPDGADVDIHAAVAGAMLRSGFADQIMSADLGAPLTRR